MTLNTNITKQINIKKPQLNMKTATKHNNKNEKT